MAGSVAQIGLRPEHRFSRTDLYSDPCDKDAECGEAVQDGYRYLKLRNLTVEVARQIGVLFWSNNVMEVNPVNAQAAYESQTALWGTINGGGRRAFLSHGADDGEL